LLNWPSCNNETFLALALIAMISTKQRRIAPVPSGHRTFNELQDASTFLDKTKLVSAAEKLKQSQNPEQRKNQRKGRIIDLLV